MLQQIIIIIKKHRTQNENEENWKNSLSLFNMINYKIVKIDGINKQE